MIRQFLVSLFVLLAAPAAFAQANLSLDDVLFVQQLAPNSRFALDAYYENSGPGAAADVKMTITIPPGLTYEGYSAHAPFQCTEPPKGGQGDLVCTASTVGIISSDIIEADLRVDSAATPGMTIPIQTTLTSSNAVKPSQTISKSLTVISPANLHLEMSAPASATAGDVFTTTITLTNQGPAAAVNAALTFTHDPHVIIGRLTGPAGWTCGSGGFCSNASFAPGTATFTVTTNVPSNWTLPSLTEKASVFSPSDADFSDDEVSATIAIVIPPKATLKEMMTAAPDVVHTGDQLTYTVTIANVGNVDAQSVSLTWVLPGTAVATTCGSLTQSVCSFPTIAAGATVTATRTIRVDAGAGTQLTANAAVDASNITFDPQSNSFVFTTVAGTSHVDLAAAITAVPAVRGGAVAPWAVSVTNLGPDTATDWQLSFSLPPNTTLVAGSLSASQQTCSIAIAQVTCHGTYLTSGSQAGVLFYLTVAPGTTVPIHATASVSTSNVDPNLQNNTVAADTFILSTSYVELSMTADRSTVAMGGRVTQTVTLKNRGPDAGTGIVLNITLPAGSSLATSSASCTGTRPIRCVMPALAEDESVQATISFNAPAKGGLFETDANVMWNNSDGTTGLTSAMQSLVVVDPSGAPPARHRAARH